MDPNWFISVTIILASLFSHATAAAVARPPPPSSSSITVVGSVYCDVCYNNSFTTHSYFLPGVDVHIQCEFQANSPRTTEKISFSVNRTTDKYGVYKLDIASVDGVDCEDSPTIQSFCQATVIRSSSSSCNLPGLSTTSSELTVKSKQNNLCIYSVSALNYRPSKRDFTLCGNNKEQHLSADSFNSSNFFLPFFPPYFFPWPQLPPFPPFPSLPPLPPLPQLPPPFPPFPPLPSLPPLPPLPSYPPSLPIPQPPPLPYPFPPLPPLTQSPFMLPPPIPPPTFNLGDPRTWVPNNPFFAPSPPPAFGLRDQRTWIPYIPPSPPHSPQSQTP